MNFFDIFFPGEVKFFLFIFLCNGTKSMCANYVKAFVILKGTKSCCQPGLLFKDAKDVFTYLSLP